MYYLMRKERLLMKTKIQLDLESMENPHNNITIIANELIRRSKEDPSLIESHNKEYKSLDGMMKYIRKEAQKRAQGGMAMIHHEEVFGLAQHYYDEDSIGVEKKSVGSIKKENEVILPEESLDIFDI